MSATPPEHLIHARWPDGGMFSAYSGDDLVKLRAAVRKDLDRLAIRDPKVAARIAVAEYRKQ